MFVGGSPQSMWIGYKTDDRYGSGLFFYYGGDLYLEMLAGGTWSSKKLT